MTDLGNVTFEELIELAGEDLLSDEDWKTIHQSLQIKAKYKKLVFERLSLWDKLLKEDPKDVPNSLQQEFKVLLKVLGIIDTDNRNGVSSEQ